MIKYLLVSGWVYSEDGDRHWIQANLLPALYGVPRYECKTEPLPHNQQGYIRDESLIVLSPRGDGNYTVPQD